MEKSLPEKIQNSIKAAIAEVGHVLMDNSPDFATNKPGFCYSIGLTDKLGFELMVCGVSGDMAASIFHTLLTNGFELDEPIDKYSNLPIMAKKATRNLELLHKEYVFQADRYYGKEVEVVQILLTDPRGKFPFQSDYDAEYMFPYQTVFAGELP